MDQLDLFTHPSLEKVEPAFTPTVVEVHAVGQRKRGKMVERSLRQEQELGQSYEEARWARLSPAFRAALCRLRPRSAASGPARSGADR